MLFLTHASSETDLPEFMERRIPHDLKWPFSLSPLAAHWTHQGSFKNHGTEATSQANQNSGARSQTQQYRGLLKEELSLLSSCPKLSEFRKEQTVTVSAIFYFGAGRPKITNRKGESRVPIQSLPPPRIQVISRLPPC